MTGFAQAQVVQRAARGTQACGNVGALIAMRAMGAPRTDHHVRPIHPGKQHRHVLRSFGIAGRTHVARIGGAIGKDIGGLKPAKPQGAGAPLAALDGGVVLHLGGFGWVEHHKHHLLPMRLPDACQAVAIGFAVRIKGGGGRVALDVMAGDHGEGFGVSLRAAQFPMEKA